MPQRAFWTEQHEMKITCSLALDPTTPGAPPWWQLSVHDQAGQLVKQATYRLPPAMAEDASHDLYKLAVETWMASSAADALIAVRRRLGEWWAHADASFGLG